MNRIKFILNLLLFQFISILFTIGIPFVTTVIIDKCFTKQMHIGIGTIIVVINIVWMVSVFLSTLTFKKWIKSFKYIIVNVISYVLIVVLLLLLLLVIPSTRWQFFQMLLDSKSEVNGMLFSAFFTMIFLNNGSASTLSIIIGPIFLIIKFTIAHIAGFLLSKHCFKKDTLVLTQ